MNSIISIAMATYNGEGYLKEQLESFTAQTRHPDQLVICDDGSSDGTVEILGKYAESAPFRTQIIKNNQRLGTGRNFAQAMDYCEGDIIAFSDQDDVWCPQKLAKIEQGFQSNPEIGYIISDAVIVDQELKPLGYTLWHRRGFDRRWQCFFESGREFDVILRLSITTGMATAIRASLRDYGRPVPDSLSHDAWYIPLGSAFGERGMLIKEPLIQYRQHRDQQYGARKMSWRGRLKYNMSEGRTSLYREIMHIEALVDFMTSWRGTSDANTVTCSLGKLKNKLIHLQARRVISEIPKMSRLLPIVKEWGSGRYHCFDTWKNIIVDMIQ
jgi:glycosyltransferase involved in cell wall biosynthesis